MAAAAATLRILPLLPERKTEWIDSYEDLITYYQKATNLNKRLFLEIITRTDRERSYLTLDTRKYYGILANKFAEKATYIIFERTIDKRYSNMQKSHEIQKKLLNSKLQSVRIVSKSEIDPEQLKEDEFQKLAFYEDIYLRR